jgi:ribosome biogenesis GTPase A
MASLPVPVNTKDVVPIVEVGEKERSRAWVREHLYKVIDESDVLLFALDVRDPDAGRCVDVEEKVRCLGNKPTFVLNKVDLVPSNAVAAWVKQLRRVAPTISFKVCLV